MNFIDDYSGYCWTRLLKVKSEAFDTFRTWLLATENQIRSKLCYLVTDNGELRSTEMGNWCAEWGITHQFTAPHTSAQNGHVEQLHCTLMDRSRAMHISCGAPLNMWDEFMITASYLTTLTASRSLKGRTPFELWFGTKLSLSHLREIGCHTFVLISGNNPKIAARSIECVLIGYTSNAKVYRCWDRQSGRVMDTHHVRFVEHLDATPHPLRPGVIMNPLSDDPTPIPIPIPIPIPTPTPTPTPSADPSLNPPPPCRSARLRKSSTPDLANAAIPDDDPDIALLVDVEAPDEPTWQEALSSVNKDKRLKGAKDELRSLEEMEVFKLVPCSIVPHDRKVLCGKFVCHLKRDEQGNPIWHKVRWVAKGFLQIWGRDFTDTTSPTACLETLRVILHIAACNDWPMAQYDVKTAFLNGVLPEKEKQFMEQPPGFILPEKASHVWKLHRGLYGMRQLSCIWNKTLNMAFMKWGFHRADCEWCVYTHRTDSAATIVAIHVDDMLSVSSSTAEVLLFHSELESTWQITALGEPKLVVGIAICHDRSTHSIFLSQTALIDKIITTYHQSDA
jgi:hypothetical protein